MAGISEKEHAFMYITQPAQGSVKGGKWKEEQRKEKDLSRPSSTAFEISGSTETVLLAKIFAKLSQMPWSHFRCPNSCAMTLYTESDCENSGGLLHSIFMCSIRLFGSLLSDNIFSSDPMLMHCNFRAVQRLTSTDLRQNRLTYNTPLSWNCHKQCVIEHMIWYEMNWSLQSLEALNWGWMRMQAWTHLKLCWCKKLKEGCVKDYEWLPTRYCQRVGIWARILQTLTVSFLCCGTAIEQCKVERVPVRYLLGETCSPIFERQAELRTAILYFLWARPFNCTETLTCLTYRSGGFICRMAEASINNVFKLASCVLPTFTDVPMFSKSSTCSATGPASHHLIGIIMLILGAKLLGLPHCNIVYCKRMLLQKMELLSKLRSLLTSRIT